MSAGAQRKTMNLLCRFFERQVFAAAAALQHAKRHFAANLAAGQVNIFFVIIVAENNSGEQFFLRNFRHFLTSEHSLLPQQEGSADSNTRRQTDDDKEP